MSSLHIPGGRRRQRLAQLEQLIAKKAHEVVEEVEDFLGMSHAHPNLTPASQAWSNDQTLHVAVAYSNPCRWETRRKLMHDFRRHMQSLPNVRLYVGELAYGDRPFEVTDPSNPLDLQLRTADELWHKENILNRVIQEFPADWKYGAYCDADFHFTRHDWALEAIHQLQHFDFVQLFSTYQCLGRRHEPGQMITGFAFNHVKRVNHRGEAVSSQKPYGWAGGPGGCWAFRRSAFEAVGGLLDTCILGSGDHYMAYGLIGEFLTSQRGMAETPAAYQTAILNWQTHAAALGGNMGYVEGHAIHHYHGSFTKRGYNWRDQILRDNQFDPYRDIVRDAQGIYQLAPGKPQLRDDIRAYFRSRDEDS